MFSTIGFEIEVDLNCIPSNLFFEKYKNSRTWRREYYLSQVEKNDLMFDVHSSSDLNSIVDNLVCDLELEIERISKCFDVQIPISSVYFNVYDSLVSNGIHIHINGVEEFKDYAVDNGIQVGVLFDKFREFLVRLYIEIFGLSGRFVFSHHVWGHYRSSRYSFKQKSKFRPVVFRREYNTFELRMFNLEDLFDVKRMKKFLRRLYRSKIDRIEKTRKSRIHKKLECMDCEFNDTWIDFVSLYGNKFRSNEKVMFDRNSLVVWKKIKMIDGSDIVDGFCRVLFCRPCEV